MVTGRAGRRIAAWEHPFHLLRVWRIEPTLSWKNPRHLPD